LCICVFDAFSFWRYKNARNPTNFSIRRTILYIFNPTVDTDLLYASECPSTLWAEIHKKPLQLVRSRLRKLHRIFSSEQPAVVFLLALSLLMRRRLGADYHNSAVSLDDLALIAHGLNGRTYFHFPVLLFCICRFYQGIGYLKPFL